MQTVQHAVNNGEGSRLALFQTWDPATRVPGRRPVVIVPGYGMNSFIFSFHPSGPSLEGFLVKAGFEVWRADLRGQGATVDRGMRADYTLEDLAFTDVRLVLDAVLARTATGATKADLIGASLGGTLMFLLAAFGKDAPLGALVSLGSPVRWVKVHPLVRLAFRSPGLVGMVPMRGTRRLAEFMLPVLVGHAPSLLSLYMNPAITDTSAAREFVKTVEDPTRFVNREIARWIQARDLIVRGQNLSEALGRLPNPLLCVSANGDGVVPLETAEFPFHASGAREKRLLRVGTDAIRMAHADLFVSRESQARVFEPITRWLGEVGA